MDPGLTRMATRTPALPGLDARAGRHLDVLVRGMGRRLVARDRVLRPAEDDDPPYSRNRHAGTPSTVRRLTPQSAVPRAVQSGIRYLQRLMVIPRRVHARDPIVRFSRVFAAQSTAVVNITFL